MRLSMTGQRAEDCLCQLRAVDVSLLGLSSQFALIRFESGWSVRAAHLLHRQTKYGVGDTQSSYALRTLPLHATSHTAAQTGSGPGTRVGSGRHIVTTAGRAARVVVEWVRRDRTALLWLRVT